MGILREAKTLLMMTLEKVPPRLRGYLSRWLIEVSSGVYVGRVSALVRDLLWEKSIDLGGDGRLIQAWTANNEQGFEVRLHGDHERHIVDFDGFLLVAKNISKTV